MKEIWKPIKGYEGHYEASTLGRIRSTKNGHRGEPRIIKPIRQTNGYVNVCLSKGGTRKCYSVHRLIASTFIDNPNNLPQINHKDENKGNNNVNNLEWCTEKYNINYGTCVKRASEARKNDPKRSKQVYQIDKDTNEIIATHLSIREAARTTGFARSHISGCCRGQGKTAYGYKWEFAK